MSPFPFASGLEWSLAVLDEVVRHRLAEIVYPNGRAAVRLL
jgi:hypothetical protein